MKKFLYKIVQRTCGRDSGSMSALSMTLKRIAKFGLILLMGAYMNANAALFGFGGTSWKEEVLLHDGSKIVVERSQSHGGRGEIGQSPIKEHSITFAVPNTGKTITWQDEYSEDVGHSNFDLLALHILNDTPYIVASAYGCLAYNKWGRPNPPYVFFKYDGKTWQRIPLSVLPAEFKDINLVINASAHEKDLVGQGLTSADRIKEFNSSLKQPEYKTILREALPNAGGRCGEMVYDGKGGWIGTGWFRDQPTYEACLKYCEQQKIAIEYCPCGALFKGKK